MMERQTARLRRGSYRPLFFLPNGKSCSSCGSLLVSGNGLFLPSAEGRARLSPKRQGMHLRLRFPFWVLQHGSVRHGFACTPGRKISSPVGNHGGNHGTDGTLTLPARNEIGPLTRLHADRSEEHTSELQSTCNLVC